MYFGCSIGLCPVCRYVHVGGNINSLPAFGFTDISYSLNEVSPPSVSFKYKKDCNIKEKQWPERFGFEEIRFKRYLPNDKDEFKEHVDVGDYNSARRFLVFFLYLNNNFDGRTSFSEYDMQVYPKAGRLLMFPPTWTYLHAGFKPKLEPKYIIGSYLHYV